MVIGRDLNGIPLTLAGRLLWANYGLGIEYTVVAHTVACGRLGYLRLGNI